MLLFLFFCLFVLDIGSGACVQAGTLLDELPSSPYFLILMKCVCLSSYSLRFVSKYGVIKPWLLWHIATNLIFFCTYTSAISLFS